MQYLQLVEEGRKRDQENQNKFMQDILSQTGQGRENGRRGVSLSDFQNTRPVSFATAAEPMDAEDWLRDAERKVNTVNCNDEEKLRYTTYLLTGPAASRWEGVLAMKPPEAVITWDEFKERFRNTHVPDSIMEIKKREFENLR